MNSELPGKTALVTGASRGIGKAVAIALAQAGVKVAVNYLVNNDLAEEVCRQIEACGGRSLAVRADVSSAGAVSLLLGTVEKELGTVDILVNNAGIGRPSSIETISEQDWDDTLCANLKSAFLLTQAVLPAMRRKAWGRIINLSSTAAHIGGIIGPHYAASKAGILGLTHYYAAALAKEGITVNSIAPALVETEMITSNPRASTRAIPVGRFGAVEEVARAAVMLADNGYITGQTVSVNGGLYMT
ncbi:MAG: 3-oxoacyl-ACP reductase FabG [Negativicutes bacterium]|nr:3-oxoacyl-ACP reductase FabG [Negativicutes bacterium]